MKTDFCAFDSDYLMSEYAATPLARLGERLALSFLLAGISLPRRHFVPIALPSAPSGSFN